jgi:hypothetical protein
VEIEANSVIILMFWLSSLTVLYIKMVSASTILDMPSSWSADFYKITSAEAFYIQAFFKSSVLRGEPY